MTAPGLSRIVVGKAPTRVVVGAPGIVGPRGPAGSSGASYEHTEGSPSALWTIAHNLGFRPSVTVLSTGGLEVLADVQHLSVNTLTVTLLAPMAGSARLT
jgi:hypothetical protein